MKRALIIAADGVEMTEAIGTYDVLRRSGTIVPSFASLRDNLVRSSMGVDFVADPLENLDLEGFDFLVLPGGKEGVERIKNSTKAREVIHDFIGKGKHVHAICAAPSILGEIGYLKGKMYTCYPGFQSKEGEWVDTGVVCDQGLVTGRSMGFTIPFALKIVELESGVDAAEKARKGIEGIK